MYAIQSDAYSHLIVLYRRQCTYIRLQGMTDETVKKVRHDSPGVHVVPPPKFRAVTKALIGGDIHIFSFCPTNFFLNQLSLKLISKEIRREEREYMNMHPPPPPINALVMALPKFDTV